MKPDPLADLPADLKQHMTRYNAPPGLKRRIRYMLEQQTRTASLTGLRGFHWQRWLPLGASFASGALIALSVAGWRGDAGEESRFEQQVLGSHVRSLMAGHLTDVASSDRHTVKPWFAGRLDYAPPVIDLAQEGFPLLGGRLDYLQDRPLAALVYGRRGHSINVFVQPARGGQPASGKVATRQGFQLADWTQQGMHFSAISDMGRDDLVKFVAAMQAAR